MRKLVIALSKGGVGKTTTAVNLSAGLAAAGCRVLLVEIDTQGQAARSLGLKPEAGLSELVAGEAAPQEAIVPARDGLWLLAGGRSLEETSAANKRFRRRWRPWQADTTM
jgi:chromosome partitioning protein